MAKSTPTLPHCCSTHRLAGLDVIETLFINDTLASFDKMRDHEDGCAWPAADAVEALRHTYRPWILGHIGDAIDFACDLLEQEVTA